MKLMNETFLNQPLKRELTERVVYVGIGLNSSHTDGVEKAPQQIRHISQRYSNADGSAQPLKVYDPNRGYSLEGVTIQDYGDLSEQLIASEMKKIFASRSFPMIVGGDHYITYLALKGLAQDVTVVQLDAHGDYLDASDCLHGSVMRYARALPHVKKIIHCGLRGNLNTGPGLEDSIRQGNEIITSNQLRSQGIGCLLEKISGPTYITFDTDFLDPSIAPGTGYPEPEGFDYTIAKNILIQTARKSTLIGIDFTEYNPDLDWNNITGLHLVNLMIDVMWVRGKHV